MTKIIAHRGASALAPENTLAAINKALEIGVDYIEIDVRLTLDNVPVVIHDARVNRTTNGKGPVVWYYYQSLKKLDAGSWFGPEFSNERIPSLNEVMQKVFPHTKLLIELKGSVIMQPLLAREVVKLIKKFNAEKLCIVQSFSAALLQAVQRESKEVEVNLLLNYQNEKLPFYVDRFPKLGNIYRFKKSNAVNPNYKYVSPEIIEEIHEKGKEIFCWTVNDIGTMRHLVEMGVDGIITNHPDKLKSLLDSI